MCEIESCLTCWLTRGKDWVLLNKHNRKTKRKAQRSKPLFFLYSSDSRDCNPFYLWQYSIEKNIIAAFENFSVLNKQWRLYWRSTWCSWIQRTNSWWRRMASTTLGRWSNPSSWSSTKPNLRVACPSFRMQLFWGVWVFQNKTLFKAVFQLSGASLFRVAYQLPYGQLPWLTFPARIARQLARQAHA